MFDSLDAVVLARVQFTFTVSFHFIFPAFSIGLASYLMAWYWDIAFTIGSLFAALAQGITLGAILQGIEVDGSAYGGGWLDWLSPFTVLTGVSLVVGYGALGATWLVWKTEGYWVFRGKVGSRGYH